MKKCNDVMTKTPVCCFPSETVSRVAKLMQNENVGSIPVVESMQTNKLVGIITDRDLAMRVVAYRRNANSTRVSDIMTLGVITCNEDDDIQKALDAMAVHQLRRIPVVDSEYKIVGIISQADVATRLDQPESTAVMVKEISQPKATQ